MRGNGGGDNETDGGRGLPARDLADLRTGLGHVFLDVEAIALLAREERHALLRVGGLHRVLVLQLLVDGLARDVRQVDEDGEAQDDADDGRVVRERAALVVIALGRLGARVRGVVGGEGVDRAPDAGVDDQLREGERGAEGVRPESQARGRGEEAVHDIVGVWRETDEEKQLRVVLDGAHYAFDRDSAREPARDGCTEERSREREDDKRACERCPV